MFPTGSTTIVGKLILNFDHPIKALGLNKPSLVRLKIQLLYD